MTSHKLETIHLDDSFYNCRAFFLLDGRLLQFNIGTPNFNDYDEWRLDSIVYADEPYEPEANDVNLKPISNFPDIFLSDEEVEWLGHFFSPLSDKGFDTDKEADAFDEKSNELCDRINGAVNPFDYMGYERPLTSVYFTGETDNLTHYIFDETDVDKNDEPVFGIVFEVQTQQWEPKENITVHHGLYNMTIPAMEAIRTEYYKD